MTTYFVSRHPGAVAWAQEEGFTVDAVVPHLDLALLEPGDVVIGTLPVNLVAAVCTLGGRYFHLTLSLPEAERGKELSAADLRRLGARLEEYVVQARGDGSGQAGSRPGPCRSNR